MELLKLYRFEFSDKGDTFLAEPKIPDHTAYDEDNHTPRICVCNHIMGCIRSLEIPSSITCTDKGWVESKLYLYETEVDIEFAKRALVQPTMNQVTDVWNTGEMWIMYPTIFNKVCSYVLSKQFDLPNCAYSRYQMYPDPEYPVIDRVVAPEVYGDPIDGFSFIALNELRMTEAIKYAEEHRYIP